MSTSSRKSSSSASRRSARGRVATPHGSSKITSRGRSGRPASGQPSARSAARVTPRVAPGAPVGSRAGGRGKLNTPAPRPKTPSPSSRETMRGRDGGSTGNAYVRRAAVGAGIVAGLALISLVVLFVMAHLPVFVDHRHQRRRLGARERGPDRQARFRRGGDDAAQRRHFPDHGEGLEESLGQARHHQARVPRYARGLRRGAFGCRARRHRWRYERVGAR